MKKVSSNDMRDERTERNADEMRSDKAREESEVSKLE
jgi:hypothetical protein